MTAQRDFVRSDGNCGRGRFKVLSGEDGLAVETSRMVGDAKRRMDTL